MIREDRLLLVELGRLNIDVVTAGHAHYGRERHHRGALRVAERLVAMAQRLQARAACVNLVIDGEVTIVADQNVNRSEDTVYHQDL